MTIIWHNGTFKPDQAVFMANDRLRLGDGVFDTMLCVDAHPVFAEEHFKRLKAHAAIMSMTIDITGMTETAIALLQKNNFSNGHHVINTLITRGPARRGLKIPETSDIQIIMRASYIPTDMPPPRAIIAQSVRRNEGSPLSRIKSVNYGDQILARAEADTAGANEAILLNNRGDATCATSGNIFIEKGGQLLTPPLTDGVLDGIIRSKMIRHFDVREQSVSAADLESADAILLTGSLAGVRTLESLNGRRLSAPSLQIANDFHLG